MTQVSDKPSIEEVMAHVGVMGMHWGVRKDHPPMSRNKKIAIGVGIGVGAAAVIGILAATGTLPIASIFSPEASATVAPEAVALVSNGSFAAEKLLKESLSIPFKWKDGAGYWHNYAKVGGLWVTGR